MDQKTDCGQHETSGDQRLPCQSLRLPNWKNKAALCDIGWLKLSTAVTLPPSSSPTKKILKQLPATNQPFVSQRQEVLRNTHGRKQTLKSFPTFFQDSWSSKPSLSGKTSGLSAPKKQLGQRRTFVLARKTTRDRLTEEKSSCVQQRGDLSVLSSLLMRLISVTGQETGDGGLG